MLDDDDFDDSSYAESDDDSSESSSSTGGTVYTEDSKGSLREVGPEESKILNVRIIIISKALIILYIINI